MKRRMARWALITGATGGLGKAFARHLADEKYNLFLTDMDSQYLKEMAHLFRKEHLIEVRTAAVDLTSEKQLSRMLNRVKKTKDIQMLVHCAGFGEGSTFCQGKIQDQLKMIQVHISAAVMITHAVLPEMIRKRSGSIIAVSSIAAYIPAPGGAIYSATKSFLASFMESLHMEVRKYGIKIQSLCPGLTETRFHSRLKESGKRSEVHQSIPWATAEDVVTESLKCLKKGKVICIPGYFNKSLKKILPLFPRKTFYTLSSKIANMKL